MKQQQRLLLSLGLTLGILLVWTALFPPAPPPRQEQVVRAEERTASRPLAAKLSAPTEPLQEIRIGEAQIGIGSARGGIRSLVVEGNRLLVNADPGLFSVGIIKPLAQEVAMTTAQEGAAAVSTSTGLRELEVTRTIAPSRNGDRFFSDCVIRLTNSSEAPQECQLRLLAYHPIYSSKPDDRQYEHGFVSVEGKVHKIRAKPGQSIVLPGSPKWITGQGKSYTTIVQPVSPGGLFHVEQSPGGTALGWLELPVVTLAPGASSEWSFRFYSGPMDVSYLRAAGLEEAFSLGAFSGIAKLLLGILVWSEGWLHSYGLAILFVSILIWVVFFPLTWSGIRMMRSMSEIQPQVAKIQKEHKGNPQKMNQLMMELYKKHRVNPLSGCLPMLLQMPIFLSLYQVLMRSPQLKGAGFLMIRDLAAPDAIIRFRGPVPLFGESINLLPLIMSAAMFFQQKFTSSFQKPATEEQAVQQQVFKFMPVMFGFLFYSLPSGLVLYWVINTCLTLTQYAVFRQAHK